MHEKAPDFTPAPGIVPEGVMGPDYFSVDTKDPQTGERQIKSGLVDHYVQTDFNDLPTDIQDLYKRAPEGTVFLEGDGGRYKAYVGDRFKQIQVKAEATRATERKESAPLFEAAEQQPLTVSEVAEAYESHSEAARAAVDTLKDRLVQAEAEFTEQMTQGKRGLESGAGELVRKHEEIANGIVESINTLTAGIHSPEAATRLMKVAVDKLSQLRMLTGQTMDGAQSTQKKVNVLAAEADAQDITVRRNGKECADVIEQLSLDTHEAAQVRGEISHLIDARSQAPRRVISSIDSLRGGLKRLAANDGDIQGGLARLLGQLDEVQQGASRGRFNTDEYASVLRLGMRVAETASSGSSIARLYQAELSQL